MSTVSRPNSVSGGRLSMVSGGVVYPESDGEPMGDNTLQVLWILTLIGGLDSVFRDRPDVFVAGDHFWYFVEGDPTSRVAPDAMVVFGRPKGHRSSYRQWEEDGIAPQVVFEVLSPGNRVRDMLRKFELYDTLGVEEYYVVDPAADQSTIEGWIRRAGRLTPIENIDGWISPRMGVRFAVEGNHTNLYGPDGERFLAYVDLARDRDAQREEARLAWERVDAERRRADRERSRADQEHGRAEQERERAERMAQRLRELGEDENREM